MNSKKNTLVKTIIFIAITLFLSGILMATIKNEKATGLETSKNEKFYSEAEEPDVAAQVVSKMRVGWNLGNALDAYSKSEFSYVTAQQKRDKYQIMAAYSTKPYSGWDASSTPYISSTSSSCELNWKITKLNSKKDGACGNFSFQIINNSLEDTGENTLEFSVTKAKFTTVDGSAIMLSDMLGHYSKPIKNKVTTYVVSDLTRISQLASTKDILGGTLTIEVKINHYPMPKTSNTLSKEHYYETLWGNPITSKKMIDMIKEAGFGAVRVPVTFRNHMDEKGNIDEAWLARISEVVQYVLDNDMYCIINMHHDTGDKGWLKADAKSLDTTGVKFKNAWKQIAEYFKGYDESLLFEGYNEILNSSNKWSWAGQDSYNAANQLNQIFVDTVRSTGGHNTERCLIVNTYAASIEEEVISRFVLPKDSVKNRLIVEAHYYGSSHKGITNVLARMNRKFVSQGVPVIIGECGTDFEMPETDRIKYTKHLVFTAEKYGITIFWWDDGNYANKAGAQCKYAILDRYGLKWYHPEIAKTLVQASKGQGGEHEN